jgi:pyrrolidone-carboxylate peptidase
MTASAFPADPNLKRILISGFDPFGFQNAGDIRQSNLSGAAAIAFDGTTITDGKVSARIEAVVFPTRYADFNDEIAENFLRPHLAGAQPPHLVMSISQGVSKFEFEESAGRRRSGRTSAYASYRDNLGRSGGGTPARPVEPPGLAPGAEFLHTNVSPGLVGAMRGAEGRTSAIPEETEVYDLPAGASAPRYLSGGPGSSPGLAVEGAGGGFLSNEVFYRNSLLRTGTGSTVPMIHLHTPKLAPGAADTVRNDMIERIRKILRAALPHL